MRFDLYLFQEGHTKSRQRAKSLIENGCVKLDGIVVKKPSYDISSEEHQIEITDECPYVSRGGLKLEGILNATNTDVRGKVCLDIGASTGGFTHCLLLSGASRVYAVDSGTDQLDESLRRDERVVSMENFNARGLSFDDIGEAVDIITIDVSFISQNLIIPRLCEVLKDDGVYLSLIKPQFEVGRAKVGKGGIVKDKSSRLLAVNSVIECANSCGLVCNKLIKSPIQGGDGNIEYLACFNKHGKGIDATLIKKIVFE